MEIYNEGKKEWLACPVCSSQNKNVSDNGVCQTCRGIGTIDDSAPLRGGL
jgi:RecJ-like exonuclease